MISLSIKAKGATLTITIDDQGAIEVSQDEPRAKRIYHRVRSIPHDAIVEAATSVYRGDTIEQARKALSDQGYQISHTSLNRHPAIRAAIDARESQIGLVDWQNASAGIPRPKKNEKDISNVKEETNGRQLNTETIIAAQ